MNLELILLLCLGAFLLNLPFGYYRASTRKLSWQWFVAIHLPVLLIIILRRMSGLSWQVIPFIFAADIAGQLMGGMIRTGLRGHQTAKELALEEED